MIRGVEAQTGSDLFVPDVPPGFTRTGGVRVDPPESPDSTTRVVQVWQSNARDGIYFVLTQGPDQYRPEGGKPFMINGVLGERLVIPKTVAFTEDTLMLYWRQGDVSYTMYGLAEAEAAMLKVAGFLQRQGP